MSDARQALAAAQVEGASVLVPQAFFIARTELKEAGVLLREGNYTDAREAAQLAQLAALRAREVAASLNEADRWVQTVRAEGGDWEGLQHLLQRAQTAAATGDEREALEIARRIISAAGG